jgi:hypothetical protein
MAFPGAYWIAYHELSELLPLQWTPVAILERVGMKIGKDGVASSCNLDTVNRKIRQGDLRIRWRQMHSHT